VLELSHDPRVAVLEHNDAFLDVGWGSHSARILPKNAESVNPYRKIPRRLIPFL
jgi:hypothetical protein